MGRTTVTVETPCQKADLEPLGVQEASGLGGHMVAGATYKLRYTIDGNNFLDEFSFVDSATVHVFN